jgi:hypothetical protein
MQPFYNAWPGAFLVLSKTNNEPLIQEMTILQEFTVWAPKSVNAWSVCISAT